MGVKRKAKRARSESGLDNICRSSFCILIVFTALHFLKIILLVQLNRILHFPVGAPKKAKMAKKARRSSSKVCGSGETITYLNMYKLSEVLPPCAHPQVKQAPVCLSGGQPSKALTYHSNRALDGRTRKRSPNKYLTGTPSPL